jgi:sigma-B regulation protein RsbU (phosphoserine phosphatase)
MNSTTPSAPGSLAGERQRKTRSRGRLRAFWQRVTEGLELQQLWGQFKADAKEGYGLYSRDVDWEAVRQKKALKKAFHAVWALFQAMLMKLSPARRVLLLIAMALIIFNPEFHSSDGHVSFNLQGLGATILFLLLALELADRVTMKRDLEIAREIQSWLVPATAPSFSGVDIAFATRPANTVAGDYYDAFVRSGVPASEAPSAEDARLLVVVADVAGKSVPAALLMATFQASLRALAATPSSLLDLIAGLNRYACAHSLGGLRFTTAFLGEWNPGTRTLAYVNAGHNPPLLRHVSGQIERLEVGGLPLGIDLERSYESGSATLDPGDLLLIYTDGVIEAFNVDDVEYGELRLRSLLLAIPPESAAETLKRLLGDVDNFVGPARQHDDVTCLVLRSL